MRRFHAALIVAVSLGAVVPAAGVEDLDTSRFYFGVRGGFALLPRARIAPGIEAGDGRAFGSVLGVNLSPYLGVELGMDYLEFEKLKLGHEWIGEYSMLAVLPQVRLRYPLLDGRLTPYAVAGAGVLFTEFNDRRRAGIGVPVDARDTALVGTLGAGVDFFVADNVAFGLEARWLLSSPTLEVRGRRSEADLSAVLGLLNLRVFFPGTPPPPADPSAPWPRRLYLQLRVGGVVPAQSDVGRGLEGSLENANYFSTFGQVFGISIGMDLWRHLSLELSSDGWEINIAKRGTGSISEFAVYTGMLVARVRYPVLDDRLIPFVIAGGGLTYGESNDIKPRGFALGVKSNTGFVPAGSIGAGVEYMVARNLALGLEVKYVFVRDHKVTLEGRTQKLTLDTVLTSGTLRILFP